MRGPAREQDDVAGISSRGASPETASQAVPDVTAWKAAPSAGRASSPSARRPRCAPQHDLPGAETLRLDVTDPDSIAQAAAIATDVTLLINNAGVSTGTDLITGDLETIRLELDTNFYGPLAMIRAFAPVLAANGGGAILNVLSRLSWLSFQGANAYAVSKAAAWSLTNGIRLELAEQGTQVTGVFLSSTDTDMMAAYDIPKNDPADVVRAALDGLEAGRLRGHRRRRHRRREGRPQRRPMSFRQHPRSYGHDLLPDLHRPQPLGRALRPVRGDADDRPRRHDRERRPSFHPGRPRLLILQSRLGRQRLPDRLRRPAAALRPPR